MMDAAKAGGARLMIAHCLRFSPNFALMKRLVERGWIGTVKDVTAAIGSPYEDGAQRTDFRRQRRLSGGGVLIDLGIHVIDLALWMIGEQPARVAYDASSPDGWEVESDAEVALEFPGAARATLCSSFTRPLANSVRVSGDAGWIEASLYNPSALTFFTNRARMCNHDGMQTILTDAASMYDEQIAHFCAQVGAGGDFIVRPVEVLRALGVIDTCYAAAA